MKDFRPRPISHMFSIVRHDASDIRNVTGDHCRLILQFNKQAPFVHKKTKQHLSLSGVISNGYRGGDLIGWCADRSFSFLFPSPISSRILHTVQNEQTKRKVRNNMPLRESYIHVTGIRASRTLLNNPLPRRSCRPKYVIHLRIERGLFFPIKCPLLVVHSACPMLMPTSSPDVIHMTTRANTRLIPHKGPTTAPQLP